MDKWMETFAGMKETASVQSVFGPPQTVGERTIIPMAEVMYAFCGGFGKGKAPQTPPEAEGEGGGGGAMMKARPVAVLEMTPQGMQVVPIRDETRITLALLMLGTAAVCMTGRLLGKLMAHRHHHG